MNLANLEDDATYTEVGNYYLSNDKLHDVKFIVGENQTIMKAARLPLINQSRAWWSMLSEDSPLVEKGDICLPDIEPEVFTLLLKHSYGGLESLDNLSVETVMNLCYCASKYLMKQLLKKIANRLEPKDVDSIFPALHCLLYYNLNGVEESVKKMIHRQTTMMLQHPEFLECDTDFVTYICKQDALECSELTLWNAVVEWAKHKAESSEGVQLRKWLTQPLKHIRLLTLSAVDLRDYVFPLQILDYMEIINTCKGDLSSVPTLCNNKTLRVCVVEEQGPDIADNILQNAAERNESSYCFVTGDQNIELQSDVIRDLICSAIFKESPPV